MENKDMADVLDLSRIEAGKEKIDIGDCQPRQIVAEVLSLMKTRADIKGLELAMETRGAVPAKIQSDPARLRQILVNLVGNAVKFTDAGRVCVVIRVDGHSHQPAQAVPGKGACLRFEVADTGIGILPEQQALLFQPFSRVDASTRRRFGGTGLGLAISQRLAGMLGGKLEVSGIPHEGSTFSLVLPLAEDVLASLESARPSDETPATPERVPEEMDRHVLLVEDGPDNQRLIAFLLRKAGARVTIAENGQVALETALKIEEVHDPIDLILMDMQMPVMDGYEATRRLRNAGWQGPIVALTAHAMSDDRQKCIAAGCDDYLSKPIDRKTLIETTVAWTTKERITI